MLYDTQEYTMINYASILRNRQHEIGSSESVQVQIHGLYEDSIK